MKLLTSTALFLLLIFLASVSYGQSIAQTLDRFFQPFDPYEENIEPVCESKDDRLEFVREMRVGYQKDLLDYIEKVPPETARYIAEELRRALRSRNEGLFERVARNEYYHAWQLWEAYDALEEIDPPIKKMQSTPAQSLREEVVFYYELTTESREFLAQALEYKHFDETRVRPLIPNDYNFYRRYLLNQSDFEFNLKLIIQCAIEYPETDYIEY
tara:strand:- start:152 stop:793 length:642 start_codon:yes stop_codon:yes gene_type:complete